MAKHLKTPVVPDRPQKLAWDTGWNVAHEVWSDYLEKRDAYIWARLGPHLDYDAASLLSEMLDDD